MDIRLVTNENSILLSKLNYLGEYIFAFDSWGYKNIIESKLNILSWRKPYQFKFFVYVHPDMPISDTINRINLLRKHKCLPYIMRHLDCFASEEYSNFYTDLAAYCNQPNIFKKMDFPAFIMKRTKNKKRIADTLSILSKNNLALI